MVNGFAGGIFTPVLHEQQNGLFQTLQALGAGTSLPVSFGHFRAESDIPFAVTVYFRRQLYSYAVGMPFLHSFLGGFSFAPPGLFLACKSSLIPLNSRRKRNFAIGQMLPESSRIHVICHE
jgi:hypothetical protein